MRYVMALFLLTWTPMAIRGQDPRPYLQSHANRMAFATAEQFEALTLADFEALAIQDNPTLTAAAARVNVARGRQIQAGLFPNPVAGYHATEVGNLGTAGQQGGFVSQRFITGGKLRLDQAIAGREIDEAHFLYHAQQQRVLSDMRVRFFDVLTAQQRVTLTKELARIGDELVTATKMLIDGRQAAENDLLQAQIKADQSHILLDNAHNEIAEAWRRLTAVVGVPAMPIGNVTGRLEIDLQQYDWDICVAIVTRDNPALNAARTRVDRARIAIERASREPIPNVDLLVSHRHHNVTGDNVTNVQVGIPIPIFDRNQGHIRSAQAQWVAARSEVQRVELELQDRLAVAYRRYANARQQVDRYRQRMLPRARRSLNLVTNGYEMGQVQYLTLLTAQTTYFQVNLAYLDALSELRAASTLIEAQLLSGSLTNRP